jgi:hypothetical protein
MLLGELQLHGISRIQHAVTRSPLAQSSPLAPPARLREHRRAAQKYFIIDFCFPNNTVKIDIIFVN